jgi:hypothetical protein
MSKFMGIERSQIEEPKIEKSAGAESSVSPPEVLLGAIESARLKAEIEVEGRKAVQILQEIAAGRSTVEGGEIRPASGESAAGGSSLLESVRRGAPLVIGISGAMGVAGFITPEKIEAAPRPQEVRPQEQKKDAAIELTAEDRERIKVLQKHREIITQFLGEKGMQLIDSLYLLKIEAANIGNQYGKNKHESARIAMEIERSITHIAYKIFQDFRLNPRLTPERLKRIQDAVQENADRLLRETAPLSRTDYNFIRAFSMKIVKEVYDVVNDRQRPNLVWERGIFAEGLLHRFSDRTAIRNGELYNGGILHDVDPFPAEVLALRRGFFTLQQISAEEYVKQLKQLIVQGRAPQELRLMPVHISEPKLPDF